MQYASDFMLNFFGDRKLMTLWKFWLFLSVSVFNIFVFLFVVLAFTFFSVSIMNWHALNLKYPIINIIWIMVGGLFFLMSLFYDYDYVFVFVLMEKGLFLNG